MNSHSVNEWLQRNQSSPTAWHTCQVRLSAGLLACISSYQSVTESEIHQSVVKTLDFRTMLRWSSGCLRPEFLLLFHNKGLWKLTVQWNELTGSGTCRTHLSCLFSCSCFLLCGLSVSIQEFSHSWALTTISSAGKRGHSHRHKTCLTTCL